MIMTMVATMTMMMTMMTYRGDQVSGGRQGLLVIGSHALLANPDLKHDEANDHDDDYHFRYHYINDHDHDHDDHLKDGLANPDLRHDHDDDDHP